MYSEISDIFMLPNTTSILRPMDQEAVSTFKYYYLRNTLYKVIGAIDSDSSDGSM